MIRAKRQRRPELAYFGLAGDTVQTTAGARNAISVTRKQFELVHTAYE